VELSAQSEANRTSFISTDATLVVHSITLLNLVTFIFLQKQHSKDIS